MSLGKLERFWRYTAVLGPYLESGYALIEIPPYMLMGDFPYPLRGPVKEAPFADHLSVVRLLGGCEGNEHILKSHGVERIEEIDLAYRREDGSIGYRMHLLEPRLRPYIDAGYEDFTLVLDNVPYCFPEEPEVGYLGQVKPPADMGEWKAFIAEVAGTLRGIPGLDPGRLRFRLGTEMNGRGRFDGEPETFNAFYRASLRGIRSEFPDAPFGLFNMSGAGTRTVVSHYNVKPLEVAAYAVENDAVSANPLADFAWNAFSRYYGMHADPVERSLECADIWELLENGLPPKFGTPTREIHEFGIAPFGEVDRGYFPSAEPGARGAAFLAVIVWKLREAGIDKLWHWPVIDQFRDRQGRLQLLPTSEAWLYGVLEYFAGGEAFLLPVEPAGTRDARIVAAASVGDSTTHFMVAVSLVDGSPFGEVVDVELNLPEELVPAGRSLAGCLSYRRDNAIHDRIRRELETAGLLTADFSDRPTRLGKIREMTESKEGEGMAGDLQMEFEKMWVDSQTLQPPDLETCELIREGTGQKLRVTLQVPEILVLRWE